MAASPELQTVWKHFEPLVQAIKSPQELAHELFTNGLINRETRNRICFREMTFDERAHHIVSSIEGSVAATPALFHQFCAVLNKIPSLKEVADLLLRTCGECTNTWGCRC